MFTQWFDVFYWSSIYIVYYRLALFVFASLDKQRTAKTEQLKKRIGKRSNKNQITQNFYFPLFNPVKILIYSKFITDFH